MAQPHTGQSARQSTRQSSRRRASFYIPVTQTPSRKQNCRVHWMQLHLQSDLDYRMEPP